MAGLSGSELTSLFLGDRFASMVFEVVQGRFRGQELDCRGYHHDSEG